LGENRRHHGAFFQILREDFLPPFPGRKKKRKRP
jgi:hypothetical protein